MPKYTLGIDVGGTKIAAGLVDKSFKISQIKVLSTSQTDVTNQLLSLIRTYNGYSAIGLGVPGTVLENGMVKKFPNIRNFKPLNLKKYLENKFKVPVNVLNDAEAFTLGEAQLGGGRGFKKVCGVILGTGIGGGFTIKNNHKDIGPIIHRTLPDLEERMQRFGRFVRAEQYGPLTKKLLPVILRIFNPDIIIFGGGRSKIPGMQGELESNIKLLAWPSTKPKIKISKLKYAGLTGAALTVLKK